MNDHLRHIPVVFRASDRPQQFARGGLAHAAKQAADAGRHGDDMLIHVNKDEFELLREQWGEPTINPQTGLPEYFSFKKFAKKAAGPIAGAAANYLLPGSGVLGNTAVRALASGAVGAGVGYLADGKSGAISGGLAGAASPVLFGADGIGGDGGLVGNLFAGGLGTLGGLSALGGASGAAADASASTASAGAGTGASAAKGAGTALTGILGGDKAKLGMTAASMLASLAGSNSSDKEAKKAAKNEKEQQEKFNAPLPQYQLARTYVPYEGVPDYTRQGEVVYYDRNNEYDTVNAATGGSIAELMGDDMMGEDMGGEMIEPMDDEMTETQLGYITGDGDGREDLIDAKLSDGEYVFDAETVSLLGNGSNRAGAERLDEMREAIRAHKGGALSMGKISPDAMHPLQYLGAK